MENTACRPRVRRMHLRPGLCLEAELRQLAEWQSPVASFQGLLTHNSITSVSIRPGTHYPHITWAHMILRLHLGYFNFEFWHRLTLLSHCLRHVIWRGALVGWRASTPLKFLLSHIFRETWRTCRVLFRHFTSCFQKWRKCLLKIAPTDLFTWHQVTRL
jgi:hypothetical protein